MAALVIFQVRCYTFGQESELCENSSGVERLVANEGRGFESRRSPE